MLRALIYHGLRLGLFPLIKRALGALVAAGAPTSGSGASVSLAARMLIGATCGAVGAAPTLQLPLLPSNLLQKMIVCCFFEGLVLLNVHSFFFTPTLI